MAQFPKQVNKISQQLELFIVSLVVYFATIPAAITSIENQTWVYYLIVLSIIYCCEIIDKIDNREVCPFY